MGRSTSFWWIEGPLNLTDATGTLVLASQTRPEGVRVTLDVKQLKELYFWYDKNQSYPGDQSGMLHLMPRTPKRKVRAGETIALNIRMEILPDATAVLGHMGA